MKTILSVALGLALCGVATAQGEKADPVGTWKCEYKIGDQQRPAVWSTDLMVDPDWRVRGVGPGLVDTHIAHPALVMGVTQTASGVAHRIDLVRNAQLP